MRDKASAMAADWKVHKTRSSGRQPSRQMMEDLSGGSGGRDPPTLAGTNHKMPKLVENDGDKGPNAKRRSGKEELLLQQTETKKPASEQVAKQQKGVKESGIRVYKAAVSKTASPPLTNKRKLVIRTIDKPKSKLTARKSLPVLIPEKSTPPSPEKNSRSSSRRNILPIKFEFQKSNIQTRRILIRKTPAAQNESNETLVIASPAQPHLVQNGLPKITELKDNQPKLWTTARKSAPTSRNTQKNKKSTDVLDAETVKQTPPSPKSPLLSKSENNQNSPTKTSPIQIPFDDSISINAKENGDLPQEGFREILGEERSRPMRKMRSLSPASLLQGVQRAAVLGLLKSSSLPANITDQRSLEQAEINRNFRNKVSKAIAQNNSVVQISPQTPETTTLDAEASTNMEDSPDKSSDLASSSPDISQTGDQDVFDEDDPPKLTSSKDLEPLDLSNNDETMGLERSPPDIVPAEEVVQQTYPSCVDQVTSDRDNPTPIPGTTASSLTPPHAQAADFPVGTAGSATPDSSAMESSPSDARKKKKRHPRVNTHFGMKRHRTGRHGSKLNQYDSDSTDLQSEASGECQEPDPKKQRSSSSSTVASLESDAEYLSTENIDQQTTISRHLQSELPLCCCRMEQDGPSTVTLNTCRGLEIVNNELVECKNKIHSNKLHRPSSRVPYGAFCLDHKNLMIEHKCCPGCGCFCNTGVVMVCNADEKDKPQHHFHRDCIYGIAGTLYCPHCGNASGLREFSFPTNGRINSMRKIPKSMIKSGILKLPQSLVEKLTGCTDNENVPKPQEDQSLQVGPSARMSITAKEKPTSTDIEEEYSNLPSKSITLKSGSIVTSKPLPPGPGRVVLESAMEYLNTETPKRIRFFPKNVYTASSQGDMGKVLQMLAEGFDPNYRFPTRNMESALHPAAANGHLEIIVILLQAGANIDAEDEDHKTPLMSAVESNHNECMRYLIKHGATVQHKDDEGMTILHLAAKNGNLEAVKHIVTLRKINANSQDDGGWTPIIWAAEYKDIPVVQFLIERGADPNIRDKEGNSGLHWAVFSGADDVAEIFINRHGDVHAPNVHGDTPLHIATRENHYGCVTMLLLRNANIETTNKEGETPLDCAKPDSDVSLALQVNQKMKLAIANRAIRTEKIISRDIARGLETLPITVVNAVNDDPIPTDFHYVAKSCETTPLHINHSIKQPPMCTCINEDCSTDDCVCANRSVQCWYDLDGRLFKDFDYHEPPLIFECGPGCRCLRTCRNRVVQNGIRCHLQLFRTSQMGWGVRVTQDVPQGTFICEYAGELISDAEADKREDDSYLFDLDNEEREVYCIDARYYGNISRFINHLCDPNIVPVRVFIEHRDISFPRIAFFASRDIKAQEELGFDYGDKFWAIKSKFFRCCCGSVHCKHAEGSSGSSDPDS